MCQFMNSAGYGMFDRRRRGKVPVESSLFPRNTLFIDEHRDQRKAGVSILVA